MVLIKFSWQLKTSAILFICGLYFTFANYTRIDLDGAPEPCSLEGEPVPVDYIDKFRCFSCICKNGYVQCRNGVECLPIEGCHMLVEKTKDGCCQKCKGCVYKGVHYQSHYEWTDPGDPCKVIRCEAGVITESDLKCYTPCSDPLPPEEGKCCPTCPECKINGQITTYDQDVTSDDPCVKCRCSNRGMICTKKACPVLQCSKTWQHHPPGECCPRCTGTRTTMGFPKSCILQTAFLKEGMKFNIDRCTNCSCVNETSICIRNACPILECSPEFQKAIPNSCCKTCEMPLQMRTQCFYGGKVFENGESWKLDECRSCKCNQGMPSCARIRCNVTLPCGPGTKLVRDPGECCDRCQEVDGICMAYGDPHYKTFDGKMYTFHGIGKYQLVTDCHNNSFSIRVANTISSSLMRSNRNKLRTSTKRIAVRYGDVRLNLQQRFRIKYNGQIIKAPFKDEKKVSIEKVGEFVQVTLSNDVKIFWTGKSYLEVVVPAFYKNKVCGLCGNFNSNAQDDLKLKSGRVVADQNIAQFGASWCVGSKINCTKQSRQSAKIVPCTALKPEQRFCKLIANREIFGKCNSVINYSQYFRACKMDMCNCNSGKCYCEILMAYARECQRMGIDLPNWQKHTLCYPQAPKRRKISPKKSPFSSEEIERIKQKLLANRTISHRKNPLMIN